MKCTDKQLAYARRYRETHKDEILAYSKQYRDENKDQLKQYRDDRKEPLAAKKAEWAQTDKGKASSRQANQKRMEAVRQLKSQVKLHYGCMNPDCKWDGLLPAYCLEFHHIDEKLFNIGAGAKPLKALCKEINKCTVLCANCHAMETYGQLDANHFPKCLVDENGNILTTL